MIQLSSQPDNAPKSAPTTLTPEQRLAEYKRMRRVATGLLIGATLLFLVSTYLTRYWEWMHFVRAFSEAAMVGGIADWFAVTALFRYPLGLKIPHTAIIPTRKDRLAETFGRFVQNNFLSEEVIAERVRSLQISQRVAAWLSQAQNSAMVAETSMLALRGVLQVVRDEDFQNLIKNAIVARIEELKVAPLGGKLISAVLSDQRRQELLTASLHFLTNLVSQNKELIRQKIKQETPWWTFGTIDDAIYQRVVGGLEKMLQEVQNNPDHELHRRFGEILDRFSQDLQTDPEVIERGEAWKREFLNDQLVNDFANSLWHDIKEALTNIDTGPVARLRVPIEQGIAQAGQALLNNPELRAKIDTALESGVRTLMREYGHEVSKLIAGTIQRWDAETTSNRIELLVGKDLQYIRINGTLVGGLVGLIIYSVSLLLHAL